ncbi:MFS transporter [Lentzea sp. BCCO 10_0856]|uniref:MFS transporter n=1 Tax=Lentzea miocenica TaxID=3095431 RepID=A0ABU4SZH5_9PSEU|nr:MFS transporter [Lentzea sp. BCCO 10_0856]MDX8031152.1 MFS transporter [Lentzea sp. BCCO 10_0856]
MLTRDFRLVWLGQVLSQGGTRLYQIALLWWLLEQMPASSRGLAAGAFLVVGVLPSLTLVGHIGRIISRVPARTVMLRAEAVAFLAVSSLVLLGDPPVWSVYVVGLVLATCQAFFDPTLMKALPELVSPADVPRAVSYGSSTQPVANFAGAAFGAVLLASVGFSGAVVVNALTYLISVLCLLMARFESVPGVPGERGTWAFLGTLPGVKPVMLVFAGVNFFSTPTVLVLPLYTKSVLGAGAGSLALLESAVWFGLIAGALLAPRIPVRGSITSFGAVCVALFGVFLAVPGAVVSLPVYVVALVLSGFCLGVCNVKFMTLFQQIVPPAAKGRFFAALTAVLSFTFPVAFLSFGVFGDLLGAQVLVVVQGVGLLALGAVLSRVKEPAPALG